MMLRSSRVALALTALLMFGSAARAEEYWSYTYQGIEVTASGGQDRAIRLAHKLRRLDTAVVKILGRNFGDWRPPTHIYVVSTPQMQQITGSKRAGSSSFTTDSFQSNIIMDRSRDGDEDAQFFGVYYGYTGALLTSEADLRYPDWFVNGIAEVFAVTSMRFNRLEVGHVEPGYNYILHRTPLIPLRTLLGLHRNDPQVQSDDRRQLYDAECWLLVHSILVEGKNRLEFGQYLSLINAGQTEAEAFAASFKITYEELDRSLTLLITNGPLLHFVVDVPDVTDSNQPKQITAAEMNARVANYAIRRGEALDFATTLAEESLKAEPGNEYALRAMLNARLRQHDYPQALKIAAALGSTGTLSAPAYADRAAALASIAGRGGTAEADAPSLYQRARADYQHAIDLDKDNPAYWAGMADTIGSQRDAAAANQLKPQLMQLYYLHPRLGRLAHAIAFMCSETDDFDNGFKFAVAWQNNSMGDSEHDVAAAYVSHLKAYVQKRDATDPAKTPAAAP
jgi:hypothetical protein